MTWLSTWDWVLRDDDGAPGVSNDALAFLMTVVACGYAGCTYFNCAQSPERPGGRSGPRYARWVLAVSAVMVPALCATTRA